MMDLIRNVAIAREAAEVAATVSKVEIVSQ